jgi:hypothetical protein
MEDKRKGPPTQPQLERILQLMEDPRMTPYLDELNTRIDGLTNTMGGAGVLINWMKKKVGDV